MKSAKGKSREVMKLIGDKLKELRLKKGLTQTDLAKLVGKTQQNISHIENGSVSGWGIVPRLCEALKVKPNFFMPDNPRNSCKE